MNFYTQNGWAGSNYDSKLQTKDVAAKVRAFAKKNFPAFKFSITSMWSMYTDSLYIVLKSGPCAPFVEGSRSAKRGYMQTMSSVKGWESDLTAEVFAALDGVTSYASSFRYDDSDGMIDYFDTNFFLKIEVSDDYTVIEPKPKKSPKQGEPTKEAKASESDATTEGLEIVDYSEKAIAVFGDTKAIKDELKTLGGKFNPALKHNGEKRAGWIFSKKQADKVRALLAPATEPAESVALPEPPKEVDITDVLDEPEAKQESDQTNFANASKEFIQEWRANNPYPGSDRLEEFNAKFNRDYSVFVEKWAKENGTQINSYMFPNLYPIERGEYQETALDREKKAADILVESIDGNWYTLRINRQIDLKSKRIKRYDNGCIAVPESTYYKLKDKYNVMCNF